MNLNVHFQPQSFEKLRIVGFFAVTDQFGPGCSRTHTKARSTETNEEDHVLRINQEVVLMFLIELKDATTMGNFARGRDCFCKHVSCVNAKLPKAKFELVHMRSYRYKYIYDVEFEFESCFTYNYEYKHEVKFNMPNGLYIYSSFIRNVSNDSSYTILYA